MVARLSCFPLVSQWVRCERLYDFGVLVHQGNTLRNVNYCRTESIIEFEASAQVEGRKTVRAARPALSAKERADAMDCPSAVE